MPTVIDSLVVELSLSNEQFLKKQRESLEAFRKTQEEAVKGGKNIEEQSKKSMEALGGIKTQVLELFGALGGAAALIGFAANITRADAAVGRLSRSTNASAETISKWQGAALIYGSTAEGMAGSFTAISDAVAGFKVGAISPLIADFRALGSAGGRIIDVNKGVDQTLLDMADNFKAIHDRDPAQAGFMGRRMGLDAGLLDLLMKGSGEVQKMLDKVNALGPATKASVDQAGALAKAWNTVQLAFEGKGRSGVNAVGPAAALMLDTVTKDLSTPRGEFGAGFKKSSWSDYWEALKQPFVGKSAAAASPSGGRESAEAREARIRAFAKVLGVDPDVAMRVAPAEGFNKFVGDNGTSFGDFQLHVTPGGRGHAVGDEFKRVTGLDPSDPRNEAQADWFALQDIARHGWDAYHGAARVGLGAWAGIDRGAGGSTTTTKIEVNGPITINAGPNADGAAIANKFTETLKRQSFAAQANDGQN
jgi:hypothetical protein